MSARQENRWKRTLQTESSRSEDIRREIEAAHMARAPRPNTPMIPAVRSATRQQCRAWMCRNAADYEGPTQLAEAANCEIDLPAGAMDDETHWIWDEALRAFE